MEPIGNVVAFSLFWPVLHLGKMVAKLVCHVVLSIGFTYICQPAIEQLSFRVRFLIVRFGVRLLVCLCARKPPSHHMKSLVSHVYNHYTSDLEFLTQNWDCVALSYPVVLLSGGHVVMLLQPVSASTC